MLRISIFTIYCSHINKGCFDFKFRNFLNMNADSIFLNSCAISTSGCACFQKLTHDELILFEQNQVTVQFKKNEIICKQGTIAPHVIFLTKGLVKAYIEGLSDNLVLKIISSGKFVALSSILDSTNTFLYSSMAYVDSEAQLIDAKVFRQVMRQNAEFATELFNVQSGNKAQIYGRFFCMTKKQSYGRLADIILCLCDNVFGNSTFELELTRKEIAELSGMTQESVVRIIKKFKDEKLIATEGKLIKILNFDRLSQISRTG
jgi:CRP/FNR family transcriptional regulator, polysaccharide utilization system transcription regulator